MTDDYVIWKYQDVPGACVLQNFVGLDQTFRLPEGVPLEHGFPEGVAFHMNPDFPDDLLLVDNLMNTDQCMVVSPRLRDAIKQQKAVKVEYLPVSIIDHRGKLASSEYCIVHPVEPVDCIDRSKSEFKESRITPGRISRFKKMVLDESRIPADRQLFRLKDFWDVSVARRDFAEALTAKQFTGLTWLPVSAYPQR